MTALPQSSGALHSPYLTTPELTVHSLSYWSKQVGKYHHLRPGVVSCRSGGGSRGRSPIARNRACSVQQDVPVKCSVTQDGCEQVEGGDYALALRCTEGASPPPGVPPGGGGGYAPDWTAPLYHMGPKRENTV